MIPLAVISVIFAAYHKMSRSRCTERGWIPKCYRKCCSNCCQNYNKLPTPETGEGEQSAPPEPEGACGIGPALDTDDGLQEQIELTTVKEMEKYSTEAEEGKERVKRKGSKIDPTESIMTESLEDVSCQRSETNPNDNGISSESGASRQLFRSAKQKIVGFSHIETEDMPLLSTDDSEKEFKDTSYSRHAPVVHHTVCTEAPIRTFKPSVCTSSEMLADVSKCDYFITGTYWPDS